MLDYSKVRFLWRGDAGRKVSSGRYDKIYDMGPRAATGDATFATAATRPVVDELNDWYGLAIDPAATNLALQSQNFGTTWTNTGSTESLNVATVAPDGTITADKLEEDTSTGAHSISQLGIAGATGDGAYTFSCFIKAVERTFVRFELVGNAAGVSGSRAVFNLTTGAVSSTTNIGSPAGSGSARITALPNGWYRCELTSTPGTTGNVSRNLSISIATDESTFSYTGVLGSGVLLWGAQLESGSVATQYKPTTAGTTAYSAVVAPITDAIPVTGTIIVWDNMVNAYAPAVAHRIFDSEDLAGTTLRLYKDLSPNQNRMGVGMHSASVLTSGDLAWQPDNQRKRWFFAMTFNGSTVQVYRGDVQGNFAKVLDVAYTPTTAAIRDMFLHSNAAGGTQVGASFTDIMTYDAVMTEAEIEDIYYGTIPVFQQTGYAGSFVDKYRQKVQAEPSSTYDTTLEAQVLAFWSTDI